MNKYKFIGCFPNQLFADIVNNRYLSFLGADFSKFSHIPKRKKMLDLYELVKVIYKMTIMKQTHERNMTKRKTNAVEKLKDVLFSIALINTFVFE